MDINHLELPPFTVAALYGSVLSEPAPENAVAPPASAGGSSPAAWKSLGGNAQKVLVLVRYADAVHLPDKSLAFLTSVLGACKLSLADVAVVNLEQGIQPGFDALSAQFSPRILLHFNIGPEELDLPLHYPQYQLQPFSGCTFLYAPALEVLEADKNEKLKLWASLKRLFNI